MTNSELATLAITNENTPELGQYWQKRYEKFLKNNVFSLSNKIEFLLEQKYPIDAPVTPHGYLNLPVFLGKNKIVDEVMLQNCIETSVRFLDSILDIINFTPETRQLVIQNRKIGLGVLNFEEYLVSREAASRLEEIDYLGEIISSSSYRASEALAEEKGACINWENLALTIRPKVFEYWYNSETGEVKSGLDISEEFTSSNLSTSNFEIIPRRNSHILLYPGDMEWQIWSDRDDSITSNKTSSKTPKVQLPIITTDIASYNIFKPDIELEKKQLDLQANPSFDMQTSQINSFKKPKQSQEYSQFNSPEPISNLPLINPISTLQKKISSWFMIDSNSQKTEPQNKVDLSKIHETKIEKTSNDILVPKIDQPKIEPEVKNNNSVNTIVQTIIKSQILTKVEDETTKDNLETTQHDRITQEKFQPIIVQIITLLNETKQILVDQDNNLPEIFYNFEQDFELEVFQKFDLKFGVKIDFMEISSINLFEGQVYVVYQARIKGPNNNDSLLHFDFVEALHTEQNTVAYYKSMDRINRWQQSSKIKAQELLKEYIQNETNQNESKIIAQKNMFIEGLQTKIQDLSNKLIGATAQNPKKLHQTTNDEIQNDKLTLVKNDNSTLGFIESKHSDVETIPTININSQNKTQDIDQKPHCDIFGTLHSQDLISSLENKTNDEQSIITNKNTQNQHKTIETKTTSDTNLVLDSANVLLRLKKLAR